MITPEQLAEWKQMEKEATKGPWSISFPDSDGKLVTSAVPVDYDREMDYSPVYGVCRACSDDGYAVNLTFIAASRTAMPELIAEVERLQKDTNRLRDFVEQVASGVYRMTDMEGAQSDAQVLLVEMKGDAE